jgi:Fumarylacetoacetate (FAA) hydrolase family
MRIARVLEGSSPLPLLALERDGALYDAGALDRIFDTRFSPDRLAAGCDFHTRTAALGGAGLDELDERLRAGDRPAQARLVPGSFTWLPPCDTERALFVQMAAYDEPQDEPAHRLGDARGLLGHASCVPFPSGEGRPAFELGIAAVLRDDLRHADAREAERAILGYAILNTWTGGDDEARRPAWSARRVPAQLGPVLVTPDDAGDLTRLKALVRVDGKVITTSSVGGWSFSIAQSIAWVSRWMDLRAGDVVGAGCVLHGRGEATFEGMTEVMVERLGKLAGRPVQRELPR